MERMVFSIYRRQRAEGWLAGRGEVSVQNGGMQCSVLAELEMAVVRRRMYASMLVCL